MKLFILRPGFFLLALVCFLLPFQEYSCSHKPYLQVNAMNLAFGSKIDSNMIVADSSVENVKKFTEAFSNKDNLQSSHNKDTIDIVPLILAAFFCCVLAVLITILLKNNAGNWIAAVLGITIIILLFIYYFSQIQMNNQPKVLEVGTRFLYGFWLIILFAAIGSATCSLFAIRKKKAVGIAPNIHGN